ncbi:translation machinery-associated protein 16 homolog isoform X2 [Homalodisca vitripennis]|uniref:translation machinery-associated protein 16 homolog isoform X2 n=1 Tax=Homalodisca vitripennis TaxID=197043 RepID=UPI001EECC071|nr:translation machinery-associated protein 16 homolog isoform X2 [Homalodisca vitripennis]
MVKTKKGVSAASLSHPNSRKVQQLTKQVKKDAARKKAKMLHQMKLNLVGEKFLWFRDNLPQDKALDHDVIASVITQYIRRFDEELEQIALKHSIGGQRKNRQHASREDVIKLTKLQEEKEFETAGIELPNLLEPSQVEMLRKWNGELRFLQNFKLRRFSQQFLKKGSAKSRPASPVETRESNNTIKTSQSHNKDNKTISDSVESMETDVGENK